MAATGGTPIDAIVVSDADNVATCLTASRGVDDLDLAVSDILTGAVPIEEADKRIYDEVIAVATGRYTDTELYDTAQSTISVQGASF